MIVSFVLTYVLCIFLMALLEKISLYLVLRLFKPSTSVQIDLESNSRTETFNSIEKQRVIAFILQHLIVAIIYYFSDYANNINLGYQMVWWILTITHGLAHVIYPALYGDIFNENYSPIYDYIVHAGQCLCALVYHPTLIPIGIFIHSCMLIGAGIAHVDKKFLQTKLWVAISGGGVFGTIFHMLLLGDVMNSTQMLIANIIIWLTPYLGYLNMNGIPKWDSFLNHIGLFRTWYLTYFVAFQIYGIYFS